MSLENEPVPTYSAEQVQQDILETTGQKVEVPTGFYRSLFSRLFGKRLVRHNDLPNIDPLFVDRLNNYLLTQRVRSQSAVNDVGLQFESVETQSEAEAGHDRPV